MSSEPPADGLQAHDLTIGIERLERRIAEVEALEPGELAVNAPEVRALQASIDDSLAQVFGAKSDRYRRYRYKLEYAVDFPTSAVVRTIRKYREDVAKGHPVVLAMLREAVRGLQERLAEVRASPASPTSAAVLGPFERKVFIVHGHDDGPRQAVARYLEALNFEVVILNERASSGRTIIEKIEAHADVGFAVVLLTPDDVGAKKGEKVKPRARQNVLLELGYFMAHLSRARVCALMRGTVEIPTDFAGAIWVPFDDGGAWKRDLAKELAVHFEIDGNVAMMR